LRQTSHYVTRYEGQAMPPIKMTVALCQVCPLPDKRPYGDHAYHVPGLAIMMLL